MPRLRTLFNQLTNKNKSAQAEREILRFSEFNKIDPEVILEALLSDSNQANFVALQLLNRFWRHGQIDPIFLPRVEEIAVSHRSTAVRESAVSALGHTTFEDTTRIALLRCLGDTRIEVVGAALRALEGIAGALRSDERSAIEQMARTPPAFDDDSYLLKLATRILVQKSARHLE